MPYAVWFVVGMQRLNRDIIKLDIRQKMALLSKRELYDYINNKYKLSYVSFWKYCKEIQTDKTQLDDVAKAKSNLEIQNAKLKESLKIILDKLDAIDDVD